MKKYPPAPQTIPRSSTYEKIAPPTTISRSSNYKEIVPPPQTIPRSSTYEELAPSYSYLASPTGAMMESSLPHSRGIRGSSSNEPAAPDSSWTFEQNMRFEDALAHYCDAIDALSLASLDQWEKIAALVPGKVAGQVKAHYATLVEDVKNIEGGHIRLPHYAPLRPIAEANAITLQSPTLGRDNTNSNAFQNPSSVGTYHAYSRKAASAKNAEKERRKGTPWTKDEHRRFLLGLDKFGKGDWRSISRNFVFTRNATQVASHAQKYFNRLTSTSKNKRRASIHDITSV